MADDKGAAKKIGAALKKLAGTKAKGADLAKLKDIQTKGGVFLKRLIQKAADQEKLDKEIKDFATKKKALTPQVNDYNSKLTTLNDEAKTALTAVNAVRGGGVTKDDQPAISELFNEITRYAVSVQPSLKLEE